MNLWAILVPFDDQWLYVTELTETMDFNTTVVKTYETKDEATEAAKRWGDAAKAVKYDKSSS